MKFRRLTAMLTAITVTAASFSVPESISFMSTVVYAADGSWSESDGVYSYTHTDTSQEIPWLDIDITGKDWSAIKYVSADVTVSGTAAAAFGGGYNNGSDWYNCDCKPITDGTATIYLEPNGKVFSSLEINFDNENATNVGTTITISNITFSTEERDYSGVTGEWYQQNGAWHYTHGDDSTQIPASLDLLSLKPDDVDWADIKYVSADITADNAAFPVIGGNLTGEDDSWTTGSEKALSEAGTVTAYLNTNGVEPLGLCVEFWHVDWDSNFAIAAGTKITVNNITFSTTERDYSNVTGEWYEQNGNWYYRNGASAVSEIPGLDIVQIASERNTDWSTVQYISADITTTGKAQPVIDINFTGSDDDWISGTPKTVDNGTTTVYYNTNGEEPIWSNLSFWQYEDGVALAANQLITVSNITFSTEERDYSNVTGEWYSPEDGKWCFRNGDKALAEWEMPALELPMQSYVSDWSTVKYISAKVEVSGNARAVMGGEYSGEWADSAAVTIKNGSDIVLLYTEGKVFDYNNINFWNIPETTEAVSANAFITVSEITVSETYPTDYTGITGQWVKTSDGYYYNHGDRSDIAYVEGLVLDCPYDIADVQSISITAKVVMTGGTPESIKLVVTGDGKDGDWFVGYNFPFGADEQTVVRKYRGNVVSNPHLDISFGQEDLAVIAAGGSIEIYVSDISYSIDPINITYSTPNDLLIDDNETDITSSDIEHDIMYHDISRIETTGTLKIYTENIGSTQDINVFWREWSDFSNITTLETTPVAVGDGVYEIRVTEEALKIIHEKAPNACELALTGTGYKFLMATFTPDSDAPMPVPEEIKSDAIIDTDKAQLEQSKNNTIDETIAPESADDFHYGKPQGHKSGRKKHKDGHYMYALRIVEKISKDKLKNAESVAITVYSKKAKQYITLTAETCFSYLNINGFKVEAGGNDAFLTVILDNIPEDDEITFTGFTINYKK